MATKITGDTFKVKDRLRKLGGKWDGFCWVVPDDKADAAWSLVGGKPAAPIARGVASLKVLPAPDKGLFGILTINYPAGEPGLFRVESAEAVAEFSRVADPANAADFGGERDFSAWAMHAFADRADVRYWD